MTSREARETLVGTISEPQTRRRVSLSTTNHSESSDQLGDDPPACSAAMLADLAGVPVSAIRRWARRGHLKPVQGLNRLASFDLKEVHVARLLGELISGGLNLGEIDRLVERLDKSYPELDRPLLELPIVIDHGRLFLRDGETLSEPGGQQQFDFSAAETDAEPIASESPSILSLPAEEEGISVEQARELALELRDAEEPDRAIEAWRLVLATGQAVAEDHFALAELLYECDEPAAARERYYMALEIDESYLEARLNLGCLLRELGEPRLAVAALRGALERHEQYADAHYHLASTLDSIGEGEVAEHHWRTFMRLAPHSPWAAEAQRRLDPDRE